MINSVQRDKELLEPQKKNSIRPAPELQHQPLLLRSSPSPPPPAPAPTPTPAPAPAPASIASERVSQETKKIILYLAEIINIGCHADIKCSKVKVGYIVQQKMTSAHLSRIMHLDPFANFHW